MRYRLGRNDLRASTNAYMQTLVSRLFMIDDSDFPDIYSPAEQIRLDFVRMTEFNNLSTSHPEVRKIITSMLDNSQDQLEVLLRQTYPEMLEANRKAAAKQIRMTMSSVEKFENYLKAHHIDNIEFCEEVLKIARHRDDGLRKVLEEEFPEAIGGVPVVDLLLKYFQQNPQYFAVTPFVDIANESRLGIQTHKRTVRIYSTYEHGAYRVFYDTDVTEMEVIDLNTLQKKVFEGCHWRFELTPQGFEFVEVIAHGENMKDLIMGVIPKDLSWFKEIPEHFHQFKTDVKKAYRRSPFSSPLKFLFEFLPQLIEISAKVQSDFLIYHYPDDYDIADLPVRLATQALMMIGVAVADVVHYAMKGLRLLGGCLVSPLRSYNEAKAVHPLLGLVSVVTTVALLVGAGALLTPLITSSAFASASSWIISHTGVVGAFMENVGMHIAALFGESVSAAAVGTMTLAASFFALVMLPLIHYVSKRWEHELNPKVKIEAVKKDQPELPVTGDDQRIIRALTDELKKNPQPDPQLGQGENIPAEDQEKNLEENPEDPNDDANFEVIVENNPPGDKVVDDQNNPPDLARKIVPVP